MHALLQKLSLVIVQLWVRAVVFLDLGVDLGQEELVAGDAGNEDVDEVEYARIQPQAAHLDRAPWAGQQFRQDALTYRQYQWPNRALRSI